MGKHQVSHLGRWGFESPRLQPKEEGVMKFYCHICTKVVKGRIDANLQEYRLPAHKEKDGYGWCYGGGQLAEEMAA